MLWYRVRVANYDVSIFDYSDDVIVTEYYD